MSNNFVYLVVIKWCAFEADIEIDLCLLVDKKVECNPAI